MTPRSYGFAACVLLCIACGDSAAPTEPLDGVGLLQLSLTGVDSDNREYRLRDATFAINGTRYSDYQQVSASISSEDDAEPVLSTRLIYGYYTVSLAPGDWYIERITPEGPQRVTQAVLLSNQPFYVSVQQGLVSEVAFQFGVDGELVDFLGGDLKISIGVQQPLASDAGSGGSGF